MSNMPTWVKFYIAAVFLGGLALLAYVSSDLGALDWHPRSLGNVILFAGGLDQDGLPVDLVETLNIGTGKWGLELLPSGPRNVGAATVLAGRAFFGGGFVGGGVATSTVDIYEPTGLNYCEAAVNSTGFAATIAASGSASLASNDLLLSTICLPDKPFLFFHLILGHSFPLKQDVLLRVI